MYTSFGAKAHVVSKLVSKDGVDDDEVIGWKPVLEGFVIAYPHI